MSFCLLNQLDLFSRYSKQLWRSQNQQIMQAFRCCFNFTRTRHVPPSLQVSSPHKSKPRFELRQACDIRQEAEKRFNPVGIRDRLLARRKAKG
jgi:hypothetical protein